MILIVKDARPWSPEDPQLYECRILYGKDEQKYHFGFRTVAFNNHAFLFNSKEYIIRGLNRHQCYPYIGYEAPDSLQVENA